MPKLTGGQALAQQLSREGVRVIFGLPGVQLYHLLDGLYDQSEIRFITTRHEQATTYMADGYSRTGAGIGAALVVPGPGLQNASAGIGTAYSASSPILVISGQVQRHLVGGDHGALHEINDQLDTIRPVIKWGRRIPTAGEVPEAVHEAFVQLKSGRPRPVEIEISPETLAEEANVELLEPATWDRPAAPAEQIARGAELLVNAANPMIWAGGGVHAADAHGALLKVAEHLQMPVYSSAAGKGAISARHHLYMGTPGFARDPHQGRLAEYDLVFAVGSRLFQPGVPSGPQVLQLDIDPQEIGRNNPNTVGMTGDARATLEALYERLVESTPARPSRRAELEARWAERFDPTLQPEPLQSFMHAIRTGIPDDAIIVQGSPSSATTAAPSVQSTNRVRTSPPPTSGRWATPIPPPWGPRSGGRTRQWWRSRATAASCTTCRSWPPPPATGSTRWWSCSTTTRSATCCAISAPASTGAPTARSCPTPTS